MQNEQQQQQQQQPEERQQQQPEQQQQQPQRCRHQLRINIDGMPAISDSTSPILEEPESANLDEPKQQVKYGELVILGYNGCLPRGNRGKKRSKFVLYKRLRANGVKRSKHYVVKKAQSCKAVADVTRHSIYFALSKHHIVIVEYESDDDYDMFQIGRSSEAPIDFVVMDTIPGNKTGDVPATGTTISRFACRILCERENPEIARVYAAGFDKAKNIFLGEKAIKWKENDHDIDGITTNGVLFMHPRGDFSGGDAKSSYWQEISVGGAVYSLREFRSTPQKGHVVEGETNILQDGTLIDICGAILMWRSAEGLAKSPSQLDLEREVNKINADRPQGSVGMKTLVIPRKVTPNDTEQRPYVYSNCGHIQGLYDWEQEEAKKCPICSELSPIVKLFMGIEPAFYVDCGPPTFAFLPCGHMTTEKTVKYWANIPIPHGTCGYHAICPFCASPISGSPGYVRLIFQDNAD